MYTSKDMSRRSLDRACKRVPMGDISNMDINKNIITGKKRQASFNNDARKSTPARGTLAKRYDRHDTVSNLQAMFVLIEDLETNHGLVFYVMPGNKSYSD